MGKKRKYVKLEEKTAQQLIKVADEWFSKRVRLEDSELRGSEFHGTCVTCSYSKRVAYWDGDRFRFEPGWDAGHFVRRGEKVVRYNRNNVHLQCKFHCNRMRSGEPEKHRLAIDRMYGEGTAQELEELARTTTYYKLGKAELLQIISESKDAVACLQLKALS